MLTPITNDVRRSVIWFSCVTIFLLAICLFTWWWGVHSLIGVIFPNTTFVRVVIHCISLTNILTHTYQSYRDFQYHQQCRAQGHAQCTRDHANFTLVSEVIFRSPFFFVSIFLICVVRLHRAIVRYANTAANNHHISAR